MNRYAHEFPATPETEDDYAGFGPCVHCGAERNDPEDEDPPGQAGEVCRERQRRHDAFVAAALTGNIVFAGATLAAACVGGQLAGMDPREIAGRLQAAVASDAAVEAVRYADACMAELAKP